MSRPFLFALFALDGSQRIAILVAILWLVLVVANYSGRGPFD